MKQIIVGGYPDALNNASDEYNSLAGGRLWSNVAGINKQVISCDGTFRRLHVELDGVPGTNPFYFTLEVNGVASTLVAIVTAAATQGRDITHSVAVNTGDYVRLIQTRPDGNPTNTPTAKWSCEFEGDNPGESLLLSNCGSNIAATQYASVQNGTGAGSATELNVYQIIPTDGKIRDLYGIFSASPGAAPEAYTVTLRVNGADSTLTFTITAPNTTGSDTTHEVAVNAGDYVSYSIVPVNAPTVAPLVYLGAVFAPDIDGESILMGCSYDWPANAATEYQMLTGVGILVWDPTEANRLQNGQSATPSATLRKFYVRLFGAPGAGTSRDISVRVNGAASGITVTIADLATTASDLVHTYDLQDYDDLSIENVPVGVPTCNVTYWGMVCYIPSRRSIYNVAPKLLAANAI